MVGNKNPAVQSWADSKLFAIVARVATTLLVPLVLLLLNRSAAIDTRLEHLETTINLKVPDIYPRGEAIATFQAVAARLDGMDSRIDNNTKRIGTLEERQLAHH